MDAKQNLKQISKVYYYAIFKLNSRADTTCALLVVKKQGGESAFTYRTVEQVKNHIENVEQM